MVASAIKVTVKLKRHGFPQFTIILLMSRVELLKPGSGMDGNGRDVPRQWEEAGFWRNWLAFLVFCETQFV